MSVRIYKDVEEALLRFIRQMTHHNPITRDESEIETYFNPFTGEIEQVPIEADLYDSSAETSHRNYPHIFVRLMKTREDLFSNRATLQYGNQFICPAGDGGVPTSAEKAFAQVIPLNKGTIPTTGNDFVFTGFKLAKAEVGHLLRIIEGDNKGTYTITAVDKSIQTISVSNEILTGLPEFSFDSDTRTITFLDSVDFTTIRVGDTIESVDTNTYMITSIDADNLQIVIDGITIPDTNSGAKIERSTDAFLTAEPDPICFMVLDPSQPVTSSLTSSQATVGSKNVNGAIPMDAFYMIRIDNKEQAAHIEILNRVWKTFNPPRGSLPTIVRTSESAEELLTSDLPTGGSTSVSISNADYQINDKVFIIDDLTPTKSSTGGFEEVFEATVVDKVGTDTLVLDRTVPDTYTVSNCAKVVSNADYQLLFFHFVDHRTRDVEGAQYWVHEFDFHVQFYIDRQGEPTEFESNINGISTPIEDLDGTIIISDI